MSSFPEGVGMKLLPAFALALMATTAAAQETHQLERSKFFLTPSDKKGVIAEVTFQNSNSDGQHVTSTFPMSLGILQISVTATVGLADPDTMEVEVPEGLIAVPHRITIADGETGVVLIVPLSAVGM
jgi:hypothetical protein